MTTAKKPIDDQSETRAVQLKLSATLPMPKYAFQKVRFQPSRAIDDGKKNVPDIRLKSVENFSS